MILTPEEARTKACPRVLQPIKEGSLADDWLTNPVVRRGNCLADGCMAWRWAKDRSPEEVAAKNSYMHGQAKPAAGYCGL